MPARHVDELTSHCEAKCLILSESSQLEALKSVEARILDGAIKIFDDKRCELEPDAVRCNAEITAQCNVENRAAESRDWGRLFQRRSSFDNAANLECCTMLYTSGTTGRPKGVMLSQANLLANVQSKLSVLPLSAEDVRIGFLPLSHIFARTCDCFTWLASGSTLVIVPEPQAVFDALSDTRPTYINAVPYFYERLWREAQSLGMLSQDGWLQQRLGGRMRVANCGGAPLSDHVYDWIREQEVPLVTGYGLTETSPVLTSNQPDTMRRGTVGRSVPGVEIRRRDDGEIEARGDNIMLGYYRDEEQTSRTIVDGWFRTGDLGEIDADGYLTLTGRKKEILITTGGKNIEPSAIEALLNADEWVERLIVVGDGRDFPMALVVPNPNASDANKATSEIWTGRLRERLHDLDDYEKIGWAVVLPEPPTIENEMLTVKGSLRRNRILDHYSELIDRGYAEAKTRRLKSKTHQVSAADQTIHR